MLFPFTRIADTYSERSGNCMDFMRSYIFSSFVTKETLEETAGGYKDQVETYKEALERIYNKKVTKALLYFFHMGCFVEV